MSKEEIVLKNKELGIETIFSSDIETLGQVEGKVVYLNDNYEDLEKINKHEVLHLYEDSYLFRETKEAIISSYEKYDMFDFIILILSCVLHSLPRSARQSCPEYLRQGNLANHVWYNRYDGR